MEASDHMAVVSDIVGCNICLGPSPSRRPYDQISSHGDLTRHVRLLADQHTYIPNYGADEP